MVPAKIGPVEALKADFPHDYVTIDVSHDGSLCGPRAVLKSWSAQLPHLTLHTLNQLLGITQHDDEYKTFNATLELDSKNNFSIDSLAIMVRVAGQQCNDSPTSQLCAVFEGPQGRYPVIPSWPLRTEPEMRLWIYCRREVHGVTYGHYQALAAQREPEDEAKEAVSHDTNKEAKLTQITDAFAQQERSAEEPPEPECEPSQKKAVADLEARVV